jgi:TrmH family RNA methyltransferase
MREITSAHNAIIRQLEQLQRKSRARKKEGLFIIEGVRELGLAIKSGYVIQRCIICPEIFLNDGSAKPELIRKKLNLQEQTELISATAEIYQKVAYRSKTEGCIAFAKAKNHSLQDLILSDPPLILIAESIEKPGNLGALLRTADAAGIDAIILSSPVADLYNPNVIRSSVGAVFTTQIAISSTEETILYLQKQHINLYSATLQDSTTYTSQDYTLPTAIAVGTEDRGLSEQMRVAAKSRIIIPMNGIIDSMNVSVSASILMFEAVRQRQLS